MLKNIYLQRKIAGEHNTLAQSVCVVSGQRVRSGEVLLKLLADGQPQMVTAEGNCWVRFVAVREGNQLSIGDLLFIIDAVDTDEYRPDDHEVSAHSELGQDGRRGLEREGQRAFGNDVSGQLFDAPQESEGYCQQRSVKEHPLLQRMKEGVPQKMSHAEHNQVATDRFAEDASNDPELQKQLSQKLEAQLQITQSPTVAPSLTR